MVVLSASPDSMHWRSLTLATGSFPTGALSKGKGRMRMWQSTLHI